MVGFERDNAVAERAAARHHGVIARAEALDLGLTDKQIRYRLATGRWTALRPGVYAVAGVPPTWEQAVLGAVLGCAQPVLASHWTGGRLLGASVPDDVDLIEVLGDLPHWTRLQGIRCHRSKHIFDEDRIVRQGIPCTSAARLVVDLSGRLDDRELGRICDDLQRRKLLKLRDLARCNARLPRGPGRSPATVERVLGARWKDYDPGDSDFETRVLRLIAGAGLPLPRQQYRVEVQGRRRYIDLAYPAQHIAIEVQGPAHQWKSRYDDDRIRINEIVLLGWRPLEIIPAMSDAEIVDQIRRALDAFAA